MVLSINHLTGFGGGGLGGIPLTFSYLQTAQSSVNTSSYTFSSQNFGSPGSNRYIVVVINIFFTGTFGTISSVVIGGIDATSAGESGTTSSAQDMNASVFFAKVPTGTTGDIEYTCSTTATDTSVSVYSVIGELAAYSPGFGQNATSGTNPISQDVEVPAGGIVFAGGLSNDNVDFVTWSNITEDFDEESQSNDNYSSASRAAGESALTSFSVSLQSNSSTDQMFTTGTVFPLPVVGNIPVISFTDYGGNTTDSAGGSYTFASRDLGTPHESRVIYVVAEGGSSIFSNHGPSSITVGGNSCTEVYSRLSGSGNAIGAVAGYIAYPTGSTADIVIGVTGGSAFCNIHVYAIYGSETKTPIETVSSQSGSASSRSLTPTVSRPVACVGSIMAVDDLVSVTNMVFDSESLVNSDNGRIYSCRSVNKTTSFTTIATIGSSTDIIYVLTSW